MKNEFKNMSRQELRGLLAEKNAELFDLASEIDKETDFDVLLFSNVWISNGDFTPSSHCVIGNDFDIANLLKRRAVYRDMSDVIKMRYFKKNSRYR
ncbi:DUF2482 family protein [Staphylococcus aureus]|uniref:DUF2482 family protein n=1 Tax=Staphylococcus aureus TaxID=1280 RepID=UPI0018891DB5|nr:DUF2482 family protein [Staphylococcus aureus]QOW93596.1 DUF2482 family protein [Staphylococcus aureus]QOY76333.1 DUF2482 family protein [Staphylococcus aureus]